MNVSVFMLHEPAYSVIKIYFEYDYKSFQRTSFFPHLNYLLQIIIPYTSLAYVLKAGIFRMQGFPDIVPLSQGVNPKVLLLLTMEGQCFIFGGFGPSYDRIYNTIYDYQARIWRRN